MSLIYRMNRHCVLSARLTIGEYGIYFRDQMPVLTQWGDAAIKEQKSIFEAALASESEEATSLLKDAYRQWVQPCSRRNDEYRVI